MRSIMARVCLASAAALLMLPGAPKAHLCDNVYRQADKVIIKPEFTNLIVKDEVTFKMFIQNNMDRGVAEAGLEGDSEAFDVAVTPYKMEIPKAKSEKDRVSFDVNLKLKAGYSSGSYRVNFKLVGRGSEGRGREIARFTVEPDGKGVAVPAAPALTVKRCSAQAPKLDGVLDDAVWKQAASFTGFRTENGGLAANQTVGLVSFDGRNLYVAAVLTEEEVEKVKESAAGDAQEGDLDRVGINLIPKSGVLHGFVINARGVSEVCRLKPGDGKPVVCETEMRTAVGFDGKRKTWTIEAAIPFKDLGVKRIGNGETWKLNVVRFRMTDTKGEYRSCWAGVPSRHDDPDGMGKLKFETARPK